MSVQVLIGQPGPLPITVTAEIVSDAPVALTLAGSVWSNVPNAVIGITLFIDGRPSMIGASIFANPASTHMAVVPVTVPYTFTIGKHSFQLQPLSSNTMSDANDPYHVTVEY
jgi:hypothetical protein